MMESGSNTRFKFWIWKVGVLSAGNLALATALECRRYGIKCRAIVTEGISSLKKNNLEQLDAFVQEEKFSRIWEFVEDPRKLTDDTFLHPLNPFLLTGYASIASELLEDCPNSQGVVVPYGLGGLALSVTMGLKALGSEIPVFVCEIEGHSPFHSAKLSGHPIRGEKLKSFIEAMGTPTVLDSVFPRLQHHVGGTVLVSENEMRSAIKTLHTKKGLRVEGAAGAAFAGALKLAKQGRKNTAALLTGANIADHVFHGIISE